MMAIDNIEVLGDAVGGAMVARAVEPSAGEVGADGHTHEANCLNCGAALTGPFCQQCGQHGHVHRTLSAFFHDFLHGVLHFDGKLWRTLPLLAWKPGELTRRYVDGQRASFISPMALFLFSVFLMFAVLNSVGAAPFSFGSDGGFKVETSMKEDLPKLRAELAAQLRARAAAVAAHRPTDKIDAQIEESEEGIRVITEMQTKGIGPAMAAAAARNTAKADAKAGHKNDGVPKVSSNLPAVEKAWEVARANPQLAIYKLQNAAYKYSWLLIPLSLPFLWLLFPFSRRFRLYDHTVFVTYSLGFMTLLVCILALLAAAGAPMIAVAAMAIPPLHMYRQLKGSYGLSRVGALWRTGLLLFFSLLALTLWAVALTTMEFIG